MIRTGAKDLRETRILVDQVEERADECGETSAVAKQEQAQGWVGKGGVGGSLEHHC